MSQPQYKSSVVPFNYARTFRGLNIPELLARFRERSKKNRGKPKLTGGPATYYVRPYIVGGHYRQRPSRKG